MKLAGFLIWATQETLYLCRDLAIKKSLIYLQGRISFDEAVYILKRDTRHFAKRQMTWFRRERDVCYIQKEQYPDEEHIFRGNACKAFRNAYYIKISGIVRSQKEAPTYGIGKSIIHSWGIKPEVFQYCQNIADELKPRFDMIDEIAEVNQLKVIRAMQNNHVSDYHFNPGTGYGYNDDGRDTLRKKFMQMFFILKMPLSALILHAGPMRLPQRSLEI